MAAPLTATARPKCPLHPTRRVWMDGSSKNYSDAQRRIRWRCVGADRHDFHRFTLPEPTRHPVGHTDACVDCDHIYSAAEGPRTGRNATFTFREVADTLLEIGRGSTFRDAASRARRAAKRDDTNAPNLVMDWLDTFGQIVLDHFEAPLTDWPAVISIDSKPLRKRSFDPEHGVPTDAENGEVLAVLDQTASHRGVPFLMRLAGGKDAYSWLSFFRDAGLNGSPEWIVADQDRGIEKAVGIAFPNAILYRCEGHLLRNGQEAYEADKLPAWIRKTASEMAGPDAHGAPKGRDRYWKRPELWTALNEALWSADNWAKFVALVDATVPEKRWHLRLWTEEVGDLVVAQEALRKLPIGRGKPRSIGPVESVLLGKVTTQLGPRAGFFRNRSRLDVVLGLMRLEVARQASAPAYAAILRDHYKANGYASKAAWRSRRDPLNTSSIADLILRSDVEAAREREREQTAARRGRDERRREEERALREAAGLDPATGRLRRPDGLRLDAYRSIAGKVVADFPDLLSAWDWEKNTLDPHTTKASVLARAFWACPVHESHRFEATIKEKASKPSGCPFCMDRRACPTNSVAAKAEAVAKEWHKTRNDGTPDDYVRGSNQKAWWRCAKRGHVWEARINARTIYGQGCPKCAKEEQKVRERATTARRARRSRQIAKIRTFAPLIADPPPGEDF